VFWVVWSLGLWTGLSLIDSEGLALCFHICRWGTRWEGVQERAMMCKSLMTNVRLWRGILRHRAGFDIPRRIYFLAMKLDGADVILIEIEHVDLQHQRPVIMRNG